MIAAEPQDITPKASRARVGTQAPPSRATQTKQAGLQSRDSRVSHQNQQSFALNGNLPAESSPPTSSNVLSQPQVVVPSIPLSYHPDQYQSFEGSNNTEGTFRKRKLDETNGHTVGDQRAASESALQNLNDLLDEIFEAEDDISLKGDDVPSGAVFIRWNNDTPDHYFLAATYQTKLEGLLQKAESTGRFQDIPLESLSRIQRICDVPVTLACDQDFHIFAEGGEDEIAAWLARLELAENALRSSRTLLCIMSGGRREKQLYSEELLQKIVNLLGQVTRHSIIPVVEARTTGATSHVFQVAAEYRKVLAPILHGADKVLSSLIRLLRKEPLEEGCVNNVEFFGINLLFVENATTEKESVLGVQKFEAFRRNAMDMIAQVFARYTEQRKFLVGEVLHSLQKLPTTKQHARQFRLPDGKRLQLTSALLIKFAQDSAIDFGAVSGVGTDARRSDDGHSSCESEGVGSDGSENSDESGDGDRKRMPAKGPATRKSLPKGVALVKSLYESSITTVQHIIGYLVLRASTASKVGETPHRHLLDMFVEDLIAVVASAAWPAAELLLRALVSKMVEISDSPQSSAPAKTMALEILGTIGSTILDLTAEARQTANSLDANGSRLNESLLQCFEDHQNGKLDKWALIDRDGPFRVVVGYLGAQQADPQTLGAAKYHLAQWTKFALWGQDSPSLATVNHGNSEDGRKLAFDLSDVLVRDDPSTLESYEGVSSTQCRLAYDLVLLNIGLCRALPKLINVLVNSSKSDHITVRTRSLKSVTQILEKDPALLERLPQVNGLIARCANDQSAMVRENALALLGKCVLLRSAVTLDVLKPILLCTKDSSVAIRKRAMKLLKDIYQSETSDDSNPLVCGHLLQCVEDQDEATSDLACQILEEVWLLPLWSKGNTEAATVTNRVAFREYARLLINLVEDGEKHGSLLGRFLTFAASKKSKNVEANVAVNKETVAALFDMLIDTAEQPTSSSQRRILQALTFFALANPRLFSSHQLEILQPYVANLETADDLNLFRQAVIILRYILPTMLSVQREFLRKIQDELLKNVQKLAKTELNEVAACLWTINGALQNPERLVNMEVSVLTGLRKLEKAKIGTHGSVAFSQQELVKAQRLIHLAGHFGHHCDFQPQADKFKALDLLPAESIAGKIVSAIKPFAQDRLPLSVRVTALENIGLVCRAWPQIFNSSENIEMFLHILAGDLLELRKIVLLCFRDFFASQDQHHGRAALSDEKDPLSHGQLEGSMTATDKDGAAALIAQSFLKPILQAALSSQDDYALVATELATNIARQGLIHPKECWPALVALTTSPNSRIGEVARIQCQDLHLQHESMLEREYMRSVTEAFTYQCKVANDRRGYIIPSWRSKLQPMYDLIRTSKNKTQAKFISNLCARVDFDPSKLDVSSDPPGHLIFAKFLIENLAFFDYGRTEELIKVIGCMETIFGGTGAGLAFAIDTELLRVILDPTRGTPVGSSTTAERSAPSVTPARCMQLTAAAMILTILWEARSHLCKLYGVGAKEARREGRGRPPKDASRLPPKNNLISGDHFVEAVARVLQPRNSQAEAIELCRTFSELVAVDGKSKIAVEDDGSGVERPITPNIDGEGDVLVMQASGGSLSKKRKVPMSANGTPIKKKRGRPPGQRDSSKHLEDDGD